MSEKTKKILIAIPAYGNVPVPFVGCLIRLLFHRIEGYEYRLQFIQDSLIYAARNELARVALQDNCDYILWIDSDMTFPENALEVLLGDLNSGNGRDMVTALYFTRQGDHKPVIYYDVDPELKARSIKKYPEDMVFPIDGCGFGFCLMRIKVIEDVAQGYAGALFSPLEGLGEDLSFCYRLNQIGGLIWADTRVKCGHIGAKEFREEDFKHD